MVPYVRKSFAKHFAEGMEYIEGRKLEEEYDIENTSIDDEFYKKHDKLSLVKRFCNLFFKLLRINKKYYTSYSYAMEKTKKETNQAIEAMYHNLKYLGVGNSNIPMDLA